ncbi:RtcB family protein [Phosphitispora sp. TUW77]|uniref:RtcB family protein n=1 Tax=Phosphitispora sp. TUW77 TaxID=3152361 RepID=UPI003AB8D3F6
MKVPIKVWLEGKEQIEQSCLEQAINLANLPFVHKWVALMPDSHTGMGMPIGGVIAVKFAYENREQMKAKVIGIVEKWVEKYSGETLKFNNHVNCHHNYASLENHYGKNVRVHRKGAIRARENDIGIIPGAMGSYSYIVKGLGNSESFHSCSHGAGRIFSRTKAREQFSIEKVIADLKHCNVVLGKHKKNDIAEECRFAYKDIDFVIQNELDLVQPIKKLKTIGVIKG